MAPTPETLEFLVNLVFLLVTGGVAWHAIRHPGESGRPDMVRLLFGAIAALYFFVVLLQDVLDMPLF